MLNTEEITPWATVTDLAERWAAFPPAHTKLAETLLADATQYILDIAPNAANKSERTRKRVLCAVVQRALQAQISAHSDLLPVGQFESVQVSAGSYMQTLKPLNPSGDLYLTRQERIALGVGTQRADSIDLIGE